MTRLELIRALGDTLTEIDVLRGSIPPADPDRHTLNDIRATLDQQQLTLAKNQFDDTTPAYDAASKEIETINTSVRETIEDITKLEETIGNLTRLVDAVAKLLGAVFPALGVGSG